MAPIHRIAPAAFMNDYGKRVNSHCIAWLGVGQLYLGYRGEGTAPTQLAATRAEVPCRSVEQNDQSRFFGK
jgi:hypothetical protein